MQNKGGWSWKIPVEETTFWKWLDTLEEFPNRWIDALQAFESSKACKGQMTQDNRAQSKIIHAHYYYRVICGCGA